MKTQGNSESFQGEGLRDHFLLAMPRLTDAIFAHSITYLCEHNEHGAMGIVINHPLEVCVAEILEHLHISAEGRLRDIPVLSTLRRFNLPGLPG